MQRKLRWSREEAIFFRRSSAGLQLSDAGDERHVGYKVAPWHFAVRSHDQSKFADERLTKDHIWPGSAA